ncbi:OsmC family protein [Serratia ureilytica]
MDGNAGDKAPSPMEMVLMSVGGCSAIDVVSILQKGRNDVRDCEVKLTSEPRRSSAVVHPYQPAFHRYRDLTDKIVERAVNLSAEKYCSVALMLNKAATVTHSFEIRQPA